MVGTPFSLGGLTDLTDVRWPMLFILLSAKSQPWGTWTRSAAARGLDSGLGIRCYLPSAAEPKQAGLGMRYRGSGHSNQALRTRQIRGLIAISMMTPQIGASVAQPLNCLMP
jgi:hypothetical protein